MSLKSNSLAVISIVATIVVSIVAFVAVYAPEQLTQTIGFSAVVMAGLYQIVKQEESADKIEKATEVVKETLADTTKKTAAKLDATAEKLDAIEATGEKTHALSNSAHGYQLKLGMELSDFKAETTGLAKDIEAARLAREKYDEHMKGQAAADKVPSAPAPAPKEVAASLLKAASDVDPAKLLEAAKDVQAVADEAVESLEKKNT